MTKDLDETTLQLAHIIAKDTRFPYEELLEQFVPADPSSPYNLATMDDTRFEAYVQEVWKACETPPKSGFTMDEVRAFVEEKREKERQESPSGKYVVVHYDDLDETAVICGRYDTSETALQIAKEESEKIMSISRRVLSYRVYGLEGKLFDSIRRTFLDIGDEAISRTLSDYPNQN